MKKIVLGIAVLLSGLVNAQDIAADRVPSVVQNTFKQEFPNAYDVEWEFNGTSYTVEFEMGLFVDHEVVFSKTGDITQHIQDVHRKDVPKAVIQTLKENYAGYSSDDFKRIETGKDVSFFVELDKFNDDREVLLSEGGTVLSETQD